MLTLSRSMLRRLCSVQGNRTLSNVAEGAVLAEKPVVTLPSDKKKRYDAPLVDTETNVNKHSGLVAAAFASLKDNTEHISDELVKKPIRKSLKGSSSVAKQLEEQISSATNLVQLLSVADHSAVNRRHALKILSVLSDWSSTNKVKLSSFEKDPRFIKICRLLGSHQNNGTLEGLRRSDDLNMVLSIAGDDEAVKMVSSLNLSQMIKVMSALAQKKHRSPPLLRALSFHVSRQSDTISLKRAADLLYAAVSLNFPDEVLLHRVCSDILTELSSNEDKAAVVGSIATSLGLLRYADTRVLDSLCGWLASHSEHAQPQHMAALLITLGTLGYQPNNADAFFEMALKLRETDLAKASTWLDVVFALLPLKQVTPEHISSVLSPTFVDKLYQAEGIPIPVRRKLLLVDSYASLLSGYVGARLGAEGVAMCGEATPTYSKEKTQFVSSIMDTLRSLLPSDNFLRKNCNSGMGFLYEAECLLDSNCHPLPLDHVDNSDKSVYRIAVIGLDYHDLCRNSGAELGVIQTYKTLLKSKGYHVLTVPYTEFRPNDKLITRVQYIEAKMKAIVAGKA